MNEYHLCRGCGDYISHMIRSTYCTGAGAPDLLSEEPSVASCMQHRHTRALLPPATSE